MIFRHQDVEPAEDIIQIAKHHANYLMTKNMKSLCIYMDFLYFGGFMRYHYEKPINYVPVYGESYTCQHPVYDICTLYRIGTKGLAVIQQRFDKSTKSTWWGEIDPWLVNSLYLHPRFKEYFDEHSDVESDGIYPTVTVRQIMWALKMKPIQKERWETVFDRRDI